MARSGCARSARSLAGRVAPQDLVKLQLEANRQTGPPESSPPTRSAILRCSWVRTESGSARAIRVPAGTPCSSRNPRVNRSRTSTDRAGSSTAKFSIRLRAASCEPGVLTSTTRDTRASTAAMSSAPLVSRDTSEAARRTIAPEASGNSAAPAARPPSRRHTARRSRGPRPRWRRDRSHSPAWNAYSVSQYWQRSGQPVSRTNTVG